jgi:RHS repeat-associated protein
VETRSYYGADDRLRAFRKMDVRRTDCSNHEDAGVWEEYRYDALGRRVMVRTRTDGGLCNYDAWGCTPSTTTFVWAGDQLLWELKSASGSYASAAGGTVSYFHAGGIDRPLVITKGSTSIVTHQNWRGQFARGTYPNGTKSDCPPGVTSGCTPIQWPGERTTARHELEPDGEIRNWFGGLADGMRDASGQMYMRNRYYDPQTGQFTQADPIGLAGGLNAYGFAAGDPVTYSDPYGLYIVIHGSAEYRARVRARLIYIAERSETFRKIYNAAVRSDDVGFHIGSGLVQNCPGSDHCTRHTFGSGRVNINLGPRSDDEEFGFIAAHELIHGVAGRKRSIETDVPSGCAYGPGSETCAQDWEQVIRDEVSDSEQREHRRKER